ncbi:uncharacterized protein [Penaeus vannamei]|uniref:uncharacterized protein n=1 Tax=Penaeus vannamei TaxID=6689 RepID=UPI00387F9604
MYKMKSINNIRRVLKKLPKRVICIASNMHTGAIRKIIPVQEIFPRMVYEARSSEELTLCLFLCFPLYLMLLVSEMILFFRPLVLSLLAGFGHLCRFLFSKLYERIRENQINREVHDAAMEAEVVVEVRENLPDKTHAASYVEAIKLTPSRVVKFLGKLQQLEVADVMSALQRKAEIVIKIGGIIHEWRQAPEITPQSSPEVEDDDVCVPKLAPREDVVSPELAPREDDVVSPELAPREDDVVSPELAPREEEVLNKSHHHRLGGVLDKVFGRFTACAPERRHNKVPMFRSTNVSEVGTLGTDGYIDDILERFFGD